MKKIICSALSLLMAITPLAVLAQDGTSPIPGTTPVTASVTPLTFKATVPTGLPLDLDLNGVVTPAGEASIINGSIGPIKVVKVTTEATAGWTLANYTDDFTSKKVNSKDIALQFNGDNVQASGILTLTPQNWPTIEGSGNLRLNYQGKLASQAGALTNVLAANVTFILDWDDNIKNPNAPINIEASKDTLSIEETAVLSLIQKEQSPVTWSNSNTNVVELIDTKTRTGIIQKTIKAIGLGRSTISVNDENGNSASQDIFVVENELMSIKIVQQPTKTNYNENEVFNPEGIKLKTVYKLGDEYDLEYYTYDKTPIKLEQTSVRISYTEKGKTVSVDCPIVVATKDDKYVLAKDSDFSGNVDGSFQYTGTDNYVEIPHVIKGIPVTSYAAMFAVTSVEGVKSTNKNINNMSQMFYNNKTRTLEINSLDTSNVTTMQSMFFNSLSTTLDVSNFNTSNVTNMDSMFQNSLATTLNLSNFNTSNVTNMKNMFFNGQANILDLSNFNTSNVTDMKNMFSGSQVTTLDLSNFDTSNVTTMQSMFANIQATELDVGNFNTSKVNNMQNMFSGSQVTVLKLSSFKTHNVTNMGYMFYGSQATALDLSSFDTSKITNIDWMFWNSNATTGYAKTQTDANRFNASLGKPEALTFIVK